MSIVPNVCKYETKEGSGGETKAF